MAPPVHDRPAVAEHSGVVLRGVWKTYGATVALRDVTMEAAPGRIVALLGPNGAGKSTVLRVAAGASRPTRGTVLVDGVDPRPNGIRRAIGFAGHHTFLYGPLTAEENLRFYGDLYGVPSASVTAALQRFGLEAVRRRRVQELSRGLAQRVNLARALLHGPRILLLDEPFTGLDTAFADQLAAELIRLRQAGGAVLVATHEWDAARELADDAAVLVRGRLVLRAPAHSLARSDLSALYAGAAGR
ncbi:MAG TPA: heme ABC exporter ATP-binding protein CcmA [bacterium]